MYSRRGFGFPSHRNDGEPSAGADDGAALASKNRAVLADSVAGIEFGRLKSSSKNEAAMVLLMNRRWSL